jgi:hypothetical protein
MAKRKNIGLAGAILLGAATVLGGAQQVNALPTMSTVNAQAQQRSNKEAIPVEKKIVTPQMELNRHGGYSGLRNPHKHYRIDGRNQRQYRKWLRSNPHMRRSKKGK